MLNFLMRLFYGSWHVALHDGQWVKRRWVNGWEYGELSPSEQDEIRYWQAIK